jgi:hypothetical protein
MELDQALELAVVASWDELVVAGESCAIHVEYVDLSRLPVSSLEVWMIKNRGYGTLVCRYSVPASNSSVPRLGEPPMHFANSYRSQTLADNLDFIMRNQRQFSRPIDHSIHGLVQIDRPSKEAQNYAATWSRAACIETAETVRS